MRNRSMLVLFAVFVAMMSVTIVSAQTATSGYDVVYREDAAVIDGDLTDDVWGNVPTINGDFRYPWEAIEAPGTVFKAYSDKTNFYFAFEVTDEDVVEIADWAGEKTVDDEDRVELFFAAGDVDKPGDNGIPLYYCIEVDPLGRVHDYSVKYYRIFDSEWTMAGLESAAVITDSGYTVEGLIPLATFAELGMMVLEQPIKVGVYRAEFSKPADELIMQWISWVDPKTVNPDFHVNSSFGEFRFLSN